MREYSVWQAIYMSFYSRKLYRDVATHWGGFAFLYLLLLAALSVLYWTVVIQSSLNQYYVKVTDQFVAQIPVLTVKQGKISTPEKRPYLIRDAEGKEIIAIIDTTGKYKSLKDSKAGLLITETEVISTPKSTQTRIDKIPDNVNFIFEPIVVKEYLKGVFSWAWVIVFPILVVLVFLYRLIQVLLYAILGRLFGAIVKAGVTYPQVIQIGLVAITPVMAFAAIVDAFNIIIPHCAMWSFILGIGYMCYGVMANKR